MKSFSDGVNKKPCFRRCIKWILMKKVAKNNLSHHVKNVIFSLWTVQNRYISWSEYLHIIWVIPWNICDVLVIRYINKLKKQIV